MIDRHNNHITVFCQVSSIVGRQLLSRTGGKTATMEPHHNGALLIIRQSLRPYIQPQAVLSRMAIVPIEGERSLIVLPSGACSLRTSRPVCPATSYAFPAIRSRRRHETVGLCIGHSFKYIDSHGLIAGYLALFHSGHNDR